VARVRRESHEHPLVLRQGCGEVLSSKIEVACPEDGHYILLVHNEGGAAVICVVAYPAVARVVDTIAVPAAVVEADRSIGRLLQAHDTQREDDQTVNSDRIQKSVHPHCGF
jgi:hypothetical protein